MPFLFYQISNAILMSRNCIGGKTVLKNTIQINLDQLIHGQTPSLNIATILKDSSIHCFLLKLNHHKVK